MHGPEERAFFFMPPTALPSRWQGRAVELVMVPLLPDETAEMLQGEAKGPRLSPADEALVELLAGGLSADAIATRLGITRRSVQRRIARLRDDVGVTTTAELVSFFARRGF